MRSFPHYKQLDMMDCGPTCLRMVAKHYGRDFKLQYLREKSYITRNGVSFGSIADAADSIGMKTLAVKIPFEKLEKDSYILDVLLLAKHYDIINNVVELKTDDVNLLDKFLKFISEILNKVKEEDKNKEFKELKLLDFILILQK